MSVEIQRQLLARALSCSGIDRELDGAIAEAFGWSLHPRFGYWITPTGWTPVEPFEALPHFTGSMNTAAALVAHVRPNGYLEVGVSLPDGRGRARVGARDWVKAANPALAIVCALLQVLTGEAQ